MLARDDRRQAVALFRYSLIREAADPALAAYKRGALVRALAERDHLGPTGERVRVSCDTLDRWIRAWRTGGFDALLPDPRVGRPRVDLDMLDLAVTLKREQPRRSAAQIARIITEQRGTSPHERALERHFRRVGWTASSPPPRARCAPSAGSKPRPPISCGPLTPYADVGIGRQRSPPVRQGPARPAAAGTGRSR